YVLLFVAPRERADNAVAPAWLQADALGQRVRGAVHQSRTEDAQPGELAPDRHRDVERDGHRGHEAVDKAVFRQVGQPAATGVVGGAWPERIAGQDNLTPIDGIDAKESLCHLGPSG